MELLQIWQLKVAITAGLVTAMLALWNAVQQLRQKRIEHRWRQVEMAKKLWDDIFQDSCAINGAAMLDGLVRKYIIQPAAPAVEITENDIKTALSVCLQNVHDAKMHFIIDCVDALLFHWARSEHYIRQGLVKAEDFYITGEYYARRICSSGLCKPLEEYANTTGKSPALAFLNRMLAYHQTPCCLRLDV